MKYFLIIFGLFGVISILTLLTFIWPDNYYPENETIVSINGQPLTRQHIADIHDKTSPSQNNEADIGKLITTHLLLGEAQRRGLERDPTFRRSLKSYYEQSLIDTLLQQVRSEVTVNTSDKEVDKHLRAFGKIYTFYSLRTSDKLTPTKIKDSGTKHTELFDKMALSQRHTLANMQPGETATTFSLPNGRTTLYLESIQGESAPSQNYDRERVRKQIHQMKVEKELNSWVESLINEAEIMYHTTRE